MNANEKKIIIRFKEPAMMSQFNEISPKLRAIICEIAWYSQYKFGKVLIITSLIRQDNKKSVHYYGRGGDLRVWHYTALQIQQIVNYVNRNYPYSRYRPWLKTCVYHDVGKGPHLHVQVSA